jgi:DNA-binding beta-propeller fold protein YncE
MEKKVIQCSPGQIVIFPDGTKYIVALDNSLRRISVKMGRRKHEKSIRRAGTPHNL